MDPSQVFVWWPVWDRLVALMTAEGGCSAGGFSCAGNSDKPCDRRAVDDKSVLAPANGLDRLPCSRLAITLTSLLTTPLTGCLDDRDATVKSRGAW